MADVQPGQERDGERDLVELRGDGGLQTPGQRVGDPDGDPGGGPEEPHAGACYCHDLDHAYVEAQEAVAYVQPPSRGCHELGVFD